MTTRRSLAKPRVGIGQIGRGAVFIVAAMMLGGCKSRPPPPDPKAALIARGEAQWRVEGSRVRLYRDATGEEHWLDIVGNKLMWKGQEIGRVP